MKIIVTGLPRCRTTQLLNIVSDFYNLKKPKNFWGETHKYNEKIDNWLTQENVIFKLWPIHSKNYIDILENSSTLNLIAYTEDFPLFVAKLIRAEITKDWGIELRQKEKISFLNNLHILDNLENEIVGFKLGLEQVLSNKKILLKSLYINDDLSASHIQSSVDPDLIIYLEPFLKNFIKAKIQDYILEDEKHFVNYVLNRFKNKF